MCFSFAVHINKYLKYTTTLCLIRWIRSLLYIICYESIIALTYQLGMVAKLSYSLFLYQCSNRLTFHECSVATYIYQSEWEIFGETRRVATLFWKVLTSNNPSHLDNNSYPVEVVGMRGTDFPSFIVCLLVKLLSLPRMQ